LKIVRRVRLIEEAMPLAAHTAQGNDAERDEKPANWHIRVIDTKSERPKEFFKMEGTNRECM